MAVNMNAGPLSAAQPLGGAVRDAGMLVRVMWAHSPVRVNVKLEGASNGSSCGLRGRRHEG